MAFARLKDTRSRRSLSLGCALLTLAGAGGAFGEVLKGQSRDLGIEFEVAGGAAWCKPDVAVTLAAPLAGAFKPETLPFVRMLGRIRAVVMDQCPSIERLAFDATAQQRPVLSIEMTRLTRWRRLFQVDPQTRRPPCPTQEPAAKECSKRADAYLLMHRVLHGERFAQAELTSILEERETAHAIWTSGDVTGKLTIRDRTELAYASNAQLAEAVTGVIGDQCASAGAVAEKVWSDDADRNVAVRGLSCRPKAGASDHHAVLVTSAGPRFQIFSLLTIGNDAEATKIAARHMALAIGEAR